MVNTEGARSLASGEPPRSLPRSLVVLCNRPESLGVSAGVGCLALTSDPWCAVGAFQVATACSGQYSNQARNSNRPMTPLGSFTLTDSVCIDLCLKGLYDKSLPVLWLAIILPIVGLRLYDATGIPALGSSVLGHPADLEQSSQPTMASSQPTMASSQPTMASRLSDQLHAIPEGSADELLVKIPDSIPNDTGTELKNLHEFLKNKLVGSDGKLYALDAVMPEGVRNLGQHPFAKDWNGDRSTLRSVLGDLLRCPISLDSIRIPVIMVTDQGGNMQPFDRDSVVTWLRQSTQGQRVHPLSKQPVVEISFDVGTDRIIGILIGVNSLERPPAQQVMDDPASSRLTG